MKPKKSPGKLQGTLFSFFSKKESPNKPNGSTSRASGDGSSATKRDSGALDSDSTNKKAKFSPSPRRSATSNIGTTTGGSSKEADTDNPSVASQGLVGKRIKVYWPDDNKWYFGKVIDCSNDGKHTVHYDDGDKERVTLAKEKVSLCVCGRDLAVSFGVFVERKQDVRFYPPNSVKSKVFEFLRQHSLADERLYAYLRVLPCRP